MPNRSTQLGLPSRLHDHLRVEGHDLQRVSSFEYRRLTKGQRFLAAVPVDRHPQ